MPLRRDGRFHPAPVPLDDYRQRPPRTGQKVVLYCLPIGFLFPVQRNDLVAWFQTGLLCRRARLNNPNHRLSENKFRNVGSIEIQTHHEADCQEDIHGGARCRYEKPLPLRFREEFVGFPRDRVARRFPGHFHVSAQKKRTDAIIRPPYRETKKPRAKPYREGFHFDPEKFGYEEMTKFVDDYDHRKYQKCNDDIGSDVTDHFVTCAKTSFILACCTSVAIDRIMVAIAEHVFVPRRPLQ